MKLHEQWRKAEAFPGERAVNAPIWLDLLVNLLIAGPIAVFQTLVAPATEPGPCSL